MTATVAAQAIFLRLDETPPSTSSLEWWSQRRACTPWREAIADLLVVETPFTAGPAHAEVVVTFGDRRRRNSELYRPVVVRALGEALAEAGWIGDRGDLTVEFRLESGRDMSTTIALRPGGER